MIATQGLPYTQQHSDSSSRYRSDSQSREATPRRQSLTRQKSSARYPTQTQKDRERDSTSGATERSGASRLPSPPDSSSPSSRADSASRSAENLQAQAQSASASQHEHTQTHMDSSAQQSAQGSTTAAHPHTTHVNPMLPSPASDESQRWNPPGRLACEPPSEQTTVHIRDLAHVHSLARTEINVTGVDDRPLQAMKYEISGMPIGDIIEMVAALLTKITTTNDLQHDALSRNAIERNASHVKQAQAQNDGSATETSMSPLSSSVLAFHGKNVPAITILSYLSRIHKYCPTTYEVFLSLLVYFDRMTERVNDLVMKAEEAKKAGQPMEPLQSDVVMKDDDDDSSDSDDLDEDIADDDSTSGDDKDSHSGPSDKTAKPSAKERIDSAPAASQPTFFVVDSFNIHRLIIAGVTCASKFFSDVFYTNSRYAKVGGLPLAELNHLEIQFLILNDFRLAVPVEDLEAYATMLVEFYAREVVGQQTAQSMAPVATDAANTAAESAA
ncbi:cyclin-like protein interacting with PHO85 [Gnomoniopsis smithogilvyi]|uniref:Cyclin-like protein interacting with PHO85 n=1 Tax=Gnomoniopsis smithogilvyi TaxID=1191159 RepID=A0A9W9D0N9_9PEZI|nr:cyclin-like protein interacting with PHO85 [Gnomoniopsis smithogilvyi]